MSPAAENAGGFDRQRHKSEQESAPVPESEHNSPAGRANPGLNVGRIDNAVHLGVFCWKVRPSSPKRQPTALQTSGDWGGGPFHYGYLARLIDDSELHAIEDPKVRAATRQIHRDVYWKSLRLLQRDVDRIRVSRRRMMDARQEWKFERLIAESAQMSRLIWTLRIAGVAHTVHLPFMIAAVRETCAELNRLMSGPLAPIPASYAA